MPRLKVESTKQGVAIRWPWLLLGIGGIVACVVLMKPGVFFSSSAPPPHAASGTAALPAAPPPLPPAAPTAQAVAPPPPPAGPEKAAAPMPPPKEHHRKSTPKASLAAPKPAMASRGLDVADEDLPGAAAATERPTKKHAMRSRRSAPAKEEGAGAPSEQVKNDAERAEPDRDSDGAAPAGRSDSTALARLLPGLFAAKFPEHMRLNVSTHVRVTVADKSGEKSARAALEAAPVGPGPAQVVTADVLVGQTLRVELRALQSQFEILPITPSEQSLMPGRPTMWEWAVVPHEAGDHELSVVVTNLKDWTGKPLDLTVQALTVTVEITTMQRLAEVANLISRGISALAGLLGAWMGLLRPLLRRRERDSERDSEKDKDKGDKDKGDKDKGDKDKGDKDKGDKDKAPPQAEDAAGNAASPSPP